MSNKLDALRSRQDADKRVADEAAGTGRFAPDAFANGDALFERRQRRDALYAKLNLLRRVYSSLTRPECLNLRCMSCNHLLSEGSRGAYRHKTLPLEYCSKCLLADDAGGS
jgi:hypothetical protein